MEITAGYTPPFCPHDTHASPDASICCNESSRVYDYTRNDRSRTVNSAVLIRLLEEDGWSEVRVKGSHHHFKHPTKPNLVTVPHPKKDLPIGTVKGILKTAGL